MASSLSPSHPVIFTTQMSCALTSWQKFMIPLDWKHTLELEYFESVVPPQRMSELPHQDWVSSTLRNGHLRLFDYSQNLLLDVSVHQSPITSVCILRVPLHTPSLLHTSPPSSISTDASGSHLLTSSWDGLIGVWDTSIPDDQQKKRRKTAPANKKRKAPIAVLKSHTARVSKALSAAGEPTKGKTYSCSFDSTVRTWDVESGVCINTINVPEHRTVSIFDLRVSSLSSSTGIMMHPATPSSIATSESGSHQVVTGSYDGIARLWDLRSTKGAVTSFRVWDGMKVLAVDWAGDVVGIGGEGGMEVWSDARCEVLKLIVARSEQERFGNHITMSKCRFTHPLMHIPRASG
ncbi:WD40 repeat-like protein [Suillus weaverae]|nr:WD40 repeat-like protein [Suillus weaverae]